MPDELVEGLADGVQRVFERDEGIQRVYFDLASQSVVDPGVGEILAEMKQSHRAILRELLRGLDRPPPEADVDGIVVFLVAGLEGLSLERLERGETPALARARALFVEGATAAIGRLARPPVLDLIRKVIELRPPRALRLRLAAVGRRARWSASSRLGWALWA